jgi:ABC-2 type transport system permease protein
VSTLTSARYRTDFLLSAALGLFWAGSALAPLFVLEEQHLAIDGWTVNEAALVIGWFAVLRAVLDGAITPSMIKFMEHVRKGTLDSVLLKPVDAQFLISTSGFELWKAPNLFVGLALIIWALHRLGHWPTPAGVAASGILLVGALVILHSIWIVVASVALYVVKIESLWYLLSAVFDAARWPSSVFHGVLAFVFTFLIPLTVMTTYPALALLGRLEPVHATGAALGACAFAIAARWTWLRALAAYASSG